MILDIFNTDNKYDIIYADPPWGYGGSGGTKWRPASEYYNTLSFDELKEYKSTINKISQNDCLLFM